MQRTSPAGMVIRIAVAVAGVLFVCGLVVAFKSSADSVQFFGSAKYGWLVPLLAAVIIGGLAWILLDEGDRSDSEQAAAQDVCPECDRPVLTQWRMCPYCGGMLGRPSSPSPESPND